MFNIENRRYVGSKYKLMPWIKEVLEKECPECHSLFDVFAGTGVVSSELLDLYDEFIINDFLYSNEIIYKAFFGKGRINRKKIKDIAKSYNGLDVASIPENYVSENYGEKYFTHDDALKIGYIREDIENKKDELTDKEYSVLLASLLYSFDHIAITVGHYEAYLRNSKDRPSFVFELINDLNIQGKKISIYRKDSNSLAKKVTADIAFIDPPYNSRQYSRFYHVLETVVKWEKPKLQGVAMKPPVENMSGYCNNAAATLFKDLISSLNVKYIAVTYNNTYDSKSSSSKNKITIEEIKAILEEKGKTKVYEKPYRFFNAGKTNLPSHKEYLFITKVNQ